MNSKQSKTVKNENPTNKPNDPPSSDTRDIGGYNKFLFISLILVDAQVNPKQKYLNKNDFSV